MVLSVIIVNYRVRYFLELCLHSVQRALAGIGPNEIIVVDNASADGSIEALRSLFPAVRFVENQANVGFARANNQALRLAVGEYILFLNPDTVLPEDFATKCLEFMRSEPRGSQLQSPDESVPRSIGEPSTRGIGAVGVRMIDGGGRFLPESRRGFPSPWVAFSKLAGLSALFPRSRVFAGYYLGGLPADRAHPAPVLSGACMLVPRAILGEVGGFDERFFMYAEDIDLSYRIEKAGYMNYYFPGTTIVHFKGESTKKDIRYIRLFYKAMSQFRRKHFNRGLPALWNWGMELAIWIRAGASTLGRLARGPGRAVSNSAAADDNDGPGAGAGLSPERGRKLWIAGDVTEAALVKRLLSAAGSWEIVSERGTASALLLCEGPDFSFRNCISALETGEIGQEHPKNQHEQNQREQNQHERIRHERNRRRQPDRIVLIHAAGSRSAAGSAAQEDHGETLVF